MAKITWKGEDTQEAAGPSFTRCFDMKFPKGEAVEVTDKDMIARARKNQFFSVDDEPVMQRRGPGRPSKQAADVEDAG